MRALAGLPVLLLPLLAGCGGSEPVAHGNPAPGLSPADATTVSVVSPKRQAMGWATEQPGTVLAFETTPVMAKLPGFVAKVHVDIGDKVDGPTKDGKPGTLLAELSIPELAAEGRQKAAEVKRTEADVQLAKRGVEVAEEGIAAAKALEAEAKAGLARAASDVERWASELKRMEGLSKVVDAQSLDEARKQAKTAVAARQEVDAKVVSAAAAVREAESRKARADADVVAAEARREVAVADADRVKALLEYTEIRAPFSGVVTARNVHTGHYLQNGGGKPEPLFVVARVDALRVAVDVPESLAAKATVGTKAVVKFPALGGKEVTATVARTSGSLSPDARTLRVEIDLPNADGALKPGLYAVVKLSGGGAEGFTLPTAAVLFADETAYCFAVIDGKAEKLRVKTGKAADGVVEVLGKRKASTTGGDWVPFDGTERVVNGGLAVLTDGQAVQVK